MTTIHDQIDQIKKDIKSYELMLDILQDSDALDEANIKLMKLRQTLKVLEGSSQAV